jgi:hemoglobin
MSESLFDQLGGEDAVDVAVERFYSKVLADDRIRGFFDGIDMDQQARKQKAFLTVAFGGPNKYSGRAMRAAHARFVDDGLSDIHFDAVVENLAATLTDMGVGPDLVKQVGEVAETTRNDVLGR